MSSGARLTPVAGLLLAAGASTRLGRDKLLVRLGGETLLRRAARVALLAGLDPLVVVLAPGAEAARAELHGLPCLACLNPDPTRGSGSSLAVAAAALPARVPAAVVLLADMPGVTAPMIEALVARWRQGDAPLVLSDYGGALAPPALYDQSLFEALRAATGERAGQAIVAAHRARAALLRWPAGALLDVDQPADLERLEATGQAGAEVGP